MDLSHTVYVGLHMYIHMYVHRKELRRVATGADRRSINFSIDATPRMDTTTMCLQHIVGDMRREKYRERSEEIGDLSVAQ